MPHFSLTPLISCRLYIFSGHNAKTLQFGKIHYVIVVIKRNRTENWMHMHTRWEIFYCPSTGKRMATKASTKLYSQPLANVPPVLAKGLQPSSAFK